QVALTLADPDLLTEGIAYDAASGDFYVSSVHKRKIVRVGTDGAVSDCVREGQDGLFGTLALALDGERRVLWACSSAMPEMNGFRPEDAGRAALYAFELPGGRLRARIEPPAAPRHNCNDLAL